MAWPFSKKLETKENPSGGAFFVSQPVTWSSWGQNSKSYVSEGYQGNVAVYRSNREIVTAATSIKVELYNGDTLVESHPVLDLLSRPNPMQSYAEWLTEMLTSRGLFGEMFCVATSESNPVEMWPLCPVDMQVKTSRTGIPSAYCFEKGNSKTNYSVDEQTGQSVCLFYKMYNPSNYWRGQSPLMAAALAADTFNAGQKWNYSLLKNSARPSGLVRFKNGYPGQEVISRMREYFKSSMQGENNAGEIPMLADDAEWVALSQSARDMDFSGTMKMTTKQIASAYGVPLPLVDNDASTFNNLEQAKEKLYTDTVIPMMNDLLGALNRWLLPMFGIPEYKLCLDLDSIPALEGLRQKMFARAKDGYVNGILTREEARGMVGFEPEASGTFYLDEIEALPEAEAKFLAYGFDIETKADSFKPPKTVVSNYRRGLEMHEEGQTGDGIEAGTIRMARKIAGGGSVSAEWVRKANRFWGRNERFLKEPSDSAAYASAMLWGGAAGRDWYRARYNELEGE